MALSEVAAWRSLLILRPNEFLPDPPHQNLDPFIETCAAPMCLAVGAMSMPRFGPEPFEQKLLLGLKEYANPKFNTEDLLVF